MPHREPFEIVGEITGIETFAHGLGVRIRAYLNQRYAAGKLTHWRKRKGFATIQYASGAMYYVEVHWFEAHGIGRVEETVKREIRGIR